MVILISGILPKASGHHFGIRNSDCQDVINFAASFVLHLVLDGFVSDAGLELCVTTETEPDVDYSDYPSWVVVKTGPTPDEPRQELVKIGKAAASRVHKKRMREKRLLELLERIIGEDRYARLKTWHRARRGKLLESAKRVIGEDRYARLKTWHRARRGK